jgi:hypothetical protein
MYPGYIQTAKKEENDDAAWSFDVANKVEQVHEKLYTKLWTHSARRKYRKRTTIYARSAATPSKALPQTNGRYAERQNQPSTKLHKVKPFPEEA